MFFELIEGQNQGVYINLFSLYRVEVSGTTSFYVMGYFPNSRNGYILSAVYTTFAEAEQKRLEMLIFVEDLAGVHESSLLRVIGNNLCELDCGLLLV